MNIPISRIRFSPSGSSSIITFPSLRAFFNAFTISFLSASPPLSLNCHHAPAFSYSVPIAIVSLPFCILLSFIFSYTFSLILSTRLMRYSIPFSTISAIPFSYSFSLITFPTFRPVSSIENSYPFLLRPATIALTLFPSFVTTAPSFLLPCSYRTSSPPSLSNRYVFPLMSPTSTPFSSS